MVMYRGISRGIEVHGVAHGHMVVYRVYGDEKRYKGMYRGAWYYTWVLTWVYGDV